MPSSYTYFLVYTDPAKALTPIQISPGIVDNTTTLKFPGRGVIDYGQLYDTNILNMLENFTNPVAPLRPVTGQLWYNPLPTDVLSYYNGTTWITIATATHAVSATSADSSVISNTTPAVFTATTGTGTTVMNISSVTSGTVQIGAILTGGTLSGTTYIVSFGTFTNILGTGTVNLSGTDTWTNSTSVTALPINASYYPTFVGSSTNSSQPVQVGTGLTFNPNTNNLSTTTFTGALAGNATTATDANYAAQVGTVQTSSIGTYYPLFVASSANGNQVPNVALTLNFNPNTGALTANNLASTLSAVGGTQVPNLTQVNSLISAAVASAIASSTPPGTLITYSGTAAPAGYLLCPLVATNSNGVSRTMYAALFTALGGSTGPWGWNPGIQTGDGSTTFNLPWFPEGYALVQANANVGAHPVGQVINHTHPYNYRTGTPPQSGNSTACWSGLATQQTGNPVTGGAANLAAGAKVLICVKT